MERRAEIKDEAALFWELAEPLKTRLYNFIHKSLSFSVEADDVFQDTLLRGMKYFRTFKEGLSFSTWLYTIAHNEIKKHYRKRNRQASLENPERIETPDDNIGRTLVSEVYRVAENLDVRQRDVFFLYYDTGLSVPEVSRITGFKEGNVKFILSRVRETLKKSLGE